MNLNESVRDWINHRISDYPSLAGVTLATMGETADLDPPFLGIYETGSDLHETEGVIIPGVSDFEITCELHTIPADAENGGTATTREREMRRDLYAILGDRAAIDWMTERNDWRVFDIRTPSPTSEPSEGRRLTSWVLTIIACPI